MALRFALSFDHLPIVDDTNANWSKIIGNLPIVFRKGSGSTKAHVISADGWMTARYVNQAGWSTLILPSAQLVQGSPTKSWFGVRLKMISAGSVASATSMTWLADNAYSGGSAFVQGLDYAMLGGTIGSHVNVEHYLELGFNWAAGTIDRFINGVFHSTITATGLTSQMAARNISIFIPGSSAANHQLMCRDIYWVDVLDDGKLSDRLGPQRMALLTHTVDSTDWTPSAGTPTGILNTKIGLTADALDLPTLTSQSAPSELISNLSIPAGVDARKINAVITLASAGLTSGSSGNLDITLRNGDDNTPTVSVPLTVGVVHNRSSRLGLFEKAPNGQRWTQEALEATNVVVYPN